MRLFFENLIRDKRQIEALILLARSIETLQNEICDRLDIIEGQLEEQAKREHPQASGDVLKGFKPWTQRRQERISRHFSVEQLAAKLQTGGKTDA